ncbi:helix-hairpin-helix domain-containing protein [Arthrobacter sp. C152]
MSRRDAGAAGQRARHASERLQATLGDGSRGLLRAGGGEERFEYRSPEAHAASGTGAARPGDGGAGDPSGQPARPGPALRWRIGLRLALLAGILAVLACSWFWWQAAADRPEILPLNGATPGGAPAEAAGTAPGGAAEPDSTGGPAVPPGSPGALVVVHVAGAVARPGVVQLPQGSRVHDAIAAAGGGSAGADLDRLNLALVVEDGRRIYVPQAGEELPDASAGVGPEAAGETAGGGAGPGPAAKVNLNTADVGELDALPKVGPVLAQRIVDWRKEHGPFKSIEEVDAVDGVGPKMLEALLPLVTV